jgi:hypothetical protein
MASCIVAASAAGLAAGALAQGVGVTTRGMNALISSQIR